MFCRKRVAFNMSSTELTVQLPVEEISNVGLIDDGPFTSSKGRSLSASSFYAALLQAIDGVMSLALCPQVVSQDPQHF